MGRADCDRTVITRNRIRTFITIFLSARDLGETGGSTCPGSRSQKNANVLLLIRWRLGDMKKEGRPPKMSASKCIPIPKISIIRFNQQIFCQKRPIPLFTAVRTSHS